MTNTPKCPYCGAEMELLEWALIYGGWEAAYRCQACRARSPLVKCDTRSEAAERTKEKALRGSTDWISVKDRLPGSDEEVLVCLRHGSYELGRYTNGSWESLYLSDFDIGGIDVTHWMPLPGLPKEE